MGTKLNVSQQGALAAGRFIAFWAALGKASPAGQERWSCPTTQWHRSTWSVVSGSGLPVQDRPGRTRKSPAEGYKTVQGTGTSLLWGEAESCDCSAWGRGGWRGSCQRVWTAEGRVQRGLSRALSSGAQRQDRRHRAPAGTQEVPTKHQAALLCCAGDSTGTGCPERPCSLQLWRSSKATWTWSWAVLLWVPLLSRGWTRGPPQGPSNFDHLGILKSSKNVFFSYCGWTSEPSWTVGNWTVKSYQMK